MEGDPLLEEAFVEGRSLHYLPPDAEAPAIGDPISVTAAEAGFADDEPVLGVVGRDGTAKAYSLWYLERAGAVNDVLDGQPIVATCSAHAGSAIAYGRALEGRAENLTFASSGMLWNGALVLRDRETETLWSQLEGRALRGELQGNRLEYIDSVHTSWSAWRGLHPLTLAVAKPSAESDRRGSSYADYHADSEALPTPGLRAGLGELGPKQVVWGVVVDGAAAALPDPELGRDEIRAFNVGGRPLVWVRDPGTGQVRVAEARLDGRNLVLARLPGVPPSLRLQDLESGDTLRFSLLPRLRVDRAYWFAWANSYPGSRILGAVSAAGNPAAQPLSEAAETVRED